MSACGDEYVWVEKSWGARLTAQRDRRSPGYAERMERAKLRLRRGQQLRRLHVQDVWVWLAGACQ